MRAVADQFRVDHFQFKDKAAYGRALKEKKVVQTMRGKFRFSDVGVAKKVYVKAVEEQVFSTAVGYEFLIELRKSILSSGAVPEKELPAIPVRDGGAESTEAPAAHTGNASAQRYKRLYEGQQVLNKRMKFVLFVAILIVAAFVVIDVSSEYSVFTYFTDYKAKMEEELINKYEGWEKTLKAREDALNQGQ